MIEPPIQPFGPGNRTRLQSAMFSVYHHSLGRQFELRGAPVVLLPPDVRPLDLAEALDLLKEDRALLRDALWRIIRCVPVPRRAGDVRHRYPGELVDVVGRAALQFLDERRRSYRTGANLFTAALSACADGTWEDFDLLHSLLDEQASRLSDGGRDICSATAVTLGRSVPEFLKSLTAHHDRGRVSDQVAKLEDEVGLNLRDFVDDFADTAAFMDLVEELPELARPAGVAAYPVSSVIWQNARTLATTATVTTVVRADFDTLRFAVDPLNWPVGNDVVKTTEFVTDPFLLTPVDEDENQPIGDEGQERRQVGAQCGEPRFLKETAVLSWNGDPSQYAFFENVLSIHPYSERREPGAIDLRFSLSRSVRSRVLWDERRGGLQLDHGYIKVRHLVDDRWRVTRRKTVKFSDRTPNANGRGWLDVGQMLNYLAPAGLMYWLENDISSLEVTKPSTTVDDGDDAGPSSEGDSREDQ